MTNPLTRDAARLLTEYEAADARLRTFRTRNAKVLDACADLEKTRDAAHEGLRALFAGMEGPPEGLDKTAVVASGAAFCVEVQFKRRQDSFDPSRLSATVLMTPGVVKAVDPAKVAALSATHPSVEASRIPGAWLNPVVLVKPR